MNLKAELEIELVHKKLNELRETEVMYLTKAVNDLTQMLKEKSHLAPGDDTIQLPAEAGPTKF